MARLRYNGLTAELGAALTPSAATIQFAASLTHAGGTAVPTIAGSDYIPLAILDANGQMTEIVNLTAYTSGATIGTITRGQENTAGVAHALGDAVINGPTTRDIAFSGCKLTKSATQSVASLTEVAVTFDGEAFDTDNYHSTVSNTSRLTAPFDGFFMVGGSLRIDSLAQDKRITAYLLKNGTFTGEGGYTRLTNSIAGESVSAPLTAIVQLAAGEYLEFGAYHTDTAARSVATSANGTNFWIRYLG